MAATDTSVPAQGDAIDTAARGLLAYLREHAHDPIGDVSEGLRRDVIAARAETEAGLPQLSGWRAWTLRTYTTCALGFLLHGDDANAALSALFASMHAHEQRYVR